MRNPINCFSELGRRLLMLLRQNQSARELEEEMRLPRQLREQEYMEAGMTPEEAHYSALRSFGTVARDRSKEPGDVGMELARTPS
jgi:hypothetical protein